MGVIKIAGIILIVIGVFSLTYGEFSYTKNTQEAKLGPIEFSVKEKQTINIPIWAGVVVIAIGGALLIARGK